MVIFDAVAAAAAQREIVSHKKRKLEIENISKSVHKMGKTDVCVCMCIVDIHASCTNIQQIAQYMHASMQTAATISLA